MKSFHNIERSAFRPGYVAYGFGGVFRVARVAKSGPNQWRAEGDTNTGGRVFYTRSLQALSNVLSSPASGNSLP